MLQKGFIIPLLLLLATTKVFAQVDSVKFSPELWSDDAFGLNGYRNNVFNSNINILNELKRRSPSGKVTMDVMKKILGNPDNTYLDGNNTCLVYYLQISTELNKAQLQKMILQGDSFGNMPHTSLIYSFDKNGRYYNVTVVNSGG